MAKYEKGKRQPNQGGLRDPPGGRPTREKAREKESLREAIERVREARAGEISLTYVEMALGKKEETATMRHLVDKVLPSPKQEIELGVKIVKVDSFKPE